MLKVVKPFLKRIGELYDNPDSITKPVVAIFFLTLIFNLNYQTAKLAKLKFSKIYDYILEDIFKDILIL